MVKGPDPVEIAKSVFWVGSDQRNRGLGCNPYLILDEEEAVFIDPGSVLDFEIVLEKVERLVSLDKIKHVVLHHQDPDLCSAVPLFEKAGLNANVAVHWRTSTIAQFYGIQSDFFIVNENHYRMELSSGRALDFLPAPYLHFPGAIMTFDSQSGVLFSGDLFGAFSNSAELFADDHYIERMVSFHEHYMPGIEFLRPVMDSVSSVSPEIIAPQHGAIIKKEIPKYVQTLRELVCGNFQRGIQKKEITYAAYTTLIEAIVERLVSLFSLQEVREVFNGSEFIILDEGPPLINYRTERVYHHFFDLIYQEKGIRWLTLLEPMVHKFTLQHDVSYPNAYIRTLEQNSKRFHQLDEDYSILQEYSNQLANQLEKAEETMVTDKLTGLKNADFFRYYFLNEFSQDVSSRPEYTFLFISMDNLLQINQIHGREGGDEALKQVASLISEIAFEMIEGRNVMLYKLDGPNIVLVFTNISKQGALDAAQVVRNGIFDSRVFLERVSVSVGLVFSSDYGLCEKIEECIDMIIQKGLVRIQLARRSGGNTVCDSSTDADIAEAFAKRVLLVEPDDVYRDYVKYALETRKFVVRECSFGDEAVKFIKDEMFDCIITEAMVPRYNGFAIREYMLNDVRFSKTPFILISHKKNDNMIQRCIHLKIIHYLKKPVSLEELSGLVTNITDH